MSTALDRQQAALSVAEAQQKVVEATQNVTNTQQAQAQGAQTTGETVAQAQHAVTDATQATTNAQTGLANAQQNVANTATQSADAIAGELAQMAVTQAQNNAANALRRGMRRTQDPGRSAQLSLTMAQQNAANTQIKDAAAVKAADLSLTMAKQQQAQTQIKDAEAVQQAEAQLTAAKTTAANTQIKDAMAIQSAETNLANAQKEAQAEIAAAQASTVSQFAKDMAQLTPAGRAFVNELLSMKSAWQELQSTAQTAILPGLTTFLTGVKAMMPEINTAVGQFGKQIGDAFAAAGNAMKTSQVQQIFQGLVANGLQFNQTVIPAVAGLVGALAKVGAQSGAVTGLANWARRPR